MKRWISSLAALCLAAALVAPIPAQGADQVSYLPGVTEEMTDPAFWSGRTEDPEGLLATPEELAALSAASLTAKGANMHDLKHQPETVNAKALAQSLKASAEENAKYYLGWTYTSRGEKADQAFYDEMIANSADPDAKESQPVGYAVAVVRTQLLTFPSTEPILDDPKDPDFDYQNLSTIRVNEPLVIRAASADGNYYCVLTDSASGWVRAEDVALCADKAQWLAAWDIPADKAVVICGDKVWTAASNFQPETSKRMLTMGTVLELADWPDPESLVSNRATYYNHVVYLPVRGEDGSYEKRTALLPAGKDVSLGRLPLTGENLARVAMNTLGATYGWGGMLESNDCSGLLRDIYHCFGLDMPRNTTWQTAMPAAKADLTGLCSEEKCRILDALPLGSALYFNGHTMLYLGHIDGQYYVLSSVSKIMNNAGEKTQRIRSVVLSTLDVRRASGKTWLQDLHTALIPYQTTADLPAPLWYHDGVAFCLTNGLMDAGAGGFFSPNAPATRAVITEALWRAAGKPAAGETAVPFPDVADGASYAQAALWAKEQGVIQGIDGNFRPEDTLTREQLVTILHRYTAEAAGGSADSLKDYTDAGRVSAWAREAMAWAVDRQIIRGKTATTLNPGDPVTRAELAVICQRTVQPVQSTQ